VPVLLLTRFVQALVLPVAVETPSVAVPFSDPAIATSTSPF
jgi:hypothetical protein